MFLHYLVLVTLLPQSDPKGYHHGRITTELVQETLRLHPENPDEFVLVCGPDEFTEVAGVILAEIGYPEDRMHIFV